MNSSYFIGRIAKQNVKSDTCRVIAESRGGPTSAHEIGHWLGLAHTFADDCVIGDGIDDTAPQQEATEFCEDVIERIGKDTPAVSTCGGLRPSNMENIMDYSNCRMSFTPGQIKVMKYWANQRRMLGARGPSLEPSGELFGQIVSQLLSQLLGQMILSQLSQIILSQLLSLIMLSQLSQIMLSQASQIMLSQLLSQLPSQII